MLTYAGWFDGLQVGDPVRVKFTWDRDGKMVPGRVIEVPPGGKTKAVLVEFDRMGDGWMVHQLFTTDGKGGPFLHLEHPEKESRFSTRGYYFPEERGK